MSFINILEKYENFDFENYFTNISDNDIKKSFMKEKLNEYDFLNLISPKADNYLEIIAKKSQNITKQYFGKTILLYSPLYVSNYCSNECIYCGFNFKNKILRNKLNLEEIEKEAYQISLTGIRHILVLTGEAKEITPLDYLIDIIKILKKYFSSISFEIFPLDEDEYKILKENGLDGLTIYQEVYDKKIYDKVHISGKKKDYLYRLNTPERAAKAGLRYVNIGTLFGLGEPKREAFFSALHAKYLQDKYLDVEIRLSLPRINHSPSQFKPYFEVSDKDFVKFIFAYRLFLPKVGITISTREKAEFRDAIIQLGITALSAGSKTDVGGYTNIRKSDSQFEISDKRTVSEISKMIYKKGYQPIFKDWENI